MYRDSRSAHTTVMKTAVTCIGFVLASFVGSTTAAGRDLYVHQRLGNDANAASEKSPLATIQKAVSLAGDGDVIHLLPEKAVYRQSATFVGKQGVTIEGHGCTLDGSDPLPADGWEELGDGLRRRKLPATPMGRHLLAVDGTVERMQRGTSLLPKFPAPRDLKDGQFVVEEIDAKTIWLYVRGSAKSLEWSTRVNGIATGGNNERLTIRNLAARRFLNDGFNIHGHAYELKFESIDGYDCFDEGFSAHEDATAVIDRSRFWGCENAVADVNDSVTTYRRCEFSRSMAVDALLVGAKHALVDCKIVNTPPSTALAGGGREVAGRTFRLELERVEIVSTNPATPPNVRLTGGEFSLRDCPWAGVRETHRDAKVTRIGGTTASPVK